LECDRCGTENLPGKLRCIECGKVLTKFTAPPVSEAPDGEAGEAVPVDLKRERAASGVVRGTRKDMGNCALCHGVFGPGELFEVGSKEVCETCLPRAETLHEAATAGRRGKGDDRKGKRYLQQQLIADRLRQEGKSATHGSIVWPKCYRHPDRSTKDKCAQCQKPICAMCSRRRGGKIYCPECVGKTSGISSRHVSAKFSGFSGSYLETVKEVLFSPSLFFQNLPRRGGLVRPFLFALVNWIPGNIVLIAILSILTLHLRGDTIHIETIHLVVLEPIIYGAPMMSVIFTVLGWIPIHLIARLLGGDASAEKGFRMFSLASSFSLVNIIPFAGALVAPLFATIILIRAISDVYSLGLFSSFFVFLLGFGSFLAGAYGLLYFLIFLAI